MRLLPLLICLIAMTLPHSAEAQGLDDYQWKNRILLLVDENLDTDALTSQLDVLTADKKALTERDLIIFRLTPTIVYTSNGTETKLNPQKMYGNYDLNADFTGVVLLGKDGGVKMREPFEIGQQKIFDLIDGMPMRRREIRESGQN